MSNEKIGFSYDYVEAVAVAFLDYCETLRRPLLRIEQDAHRWIYKAFDDPHFERECEYFDENRKDYITDLMRAVREKVDPDNVKPVIKKIRYTKREREQRVELFNEMYEGLRHLTDELENMDAAVNDADKLRIEAFKSAMKKRRKRTPKKTKTDVCRDFQLMLFQE